MLERFRERPVEEVKEDIPAKIILPKSYTGEQPKPEPKQEIINKNE